MDDLERITRLAGTKPSVVRRFGWASVLNTAEGPVVTHRCWDPA
jgi:hypothetical protein